MSGLTVTLVTLALIIASGFFVIIEFSLMGARRYRLEEDAANQASARAALRGMNELTLMLAAAQFGITICTFALGAVTKPAIDYALGPVLSAAGLPGWLSGPLAFAASLLLVTFLHLVVGEMAPKSWAIAHPEVAAKFIGIPSRIFMWPLRPLLIAVNAMADKLVAASGVTPVERAAVGGRDADTIRQLVEHSAETGALESNLQSQISDVISLQDVTAGELVSFDSLPTAVRAEANVAQVQRAASESGHLRVLLSNTEGGYAQVVHVRDTLTSQHSSPALDFARPALQVSAATPIYELLRTMREHKVQLALVRDETKGFDVVTMKDVMGRILPRESFAAS